MKQNKTKSRSKFRDDLTSMLTGNFRSSTPNIKKKENNAKRFSNTPTILRNDRGSIREEINDSKLIMMDINPQAARNLKNYKIINKDLFKYREYARDIKIQILK